ncbi:sulfurtransferase TusA family protein [Thermostichus vulcanus]|uniref:Sulfurtransferase TusA family protein n=1 Tax=Thermostichus vulcanus str. 'Rupite' TaxID=2813851 RepID=A0ABT0CAH6_THEVL|nr:sulfurtransferase TusA family protein [Thermostichus vulcanus]MCJ2542756.1 sulfurtransferase TusA family protein [Thermostichus vulcanus str. 'Rupite']
MTSEIGFSTGSSPVIKSVLDQRGIPCPLNYVRAKLRLERMAPGDLLELWLDAGEPLEQVPNSLAMAGHQIEKQQAAPEGHYILWVRRGTPESV